LGNAKHQDQATQPLEVVTIALNPLMKRRAAEKDVVLNGDVPLVIGGDIVVALDTEFLDENRQIVAELDGGNAAKLLTYTAHRLGHVLGFGGEGIDADHFEEDAALMFLLVVRMAGRIYDPFLPECRVTYDLTN